MAHGTEEQKARYLAPILSAEEIWCQGFSEPGAGSDLAGVRTSARLRGRPLRRRRAEGLVVVRAPRELLHPPHAQRPRVDAPRRPHVPDRRHEGAGRRGASAHADHRRGRVQRDLLHRRPQVPAENLLGEVGGGWQVAMTTLLHERGTLGFALQAALEVQVRKLIALARDRGADPLQRDRIAREWIEMQAVRFTELPLAFGADEDGDAWPGGIDLEARMVGGEPARDEARARAPRARTPRSARTTRLTAATGSTSSSAAAGTPSRRERRRSSATSSPSACSASRSRADTMDFTFTPEQDALREQAREFLAANPEPSWAQLAELGWTGVSIAEEDGGAGLTLRRGGRALRGARARALPRRRTSRRSRSTLPALPDDLRAEVAAGRRAGRSRSARSSPDLDTADADRDRRRRRDLRARGRRARDPHDDRRDPAARRRPRRRPRAPARGRGASSPRSSARRSRRSPSRRAVSRGARSSTRSSTPRRASSSARRSASTRRSRIRSRTRTRDSSSRARSRSGPPGASPPETSRRRSPRPRRKSSAAESCRRRLRDARSRCSAASASPGSTSSTGCTSARSGSRASGLRAPASRRGRRVLLDGSAELPAVAGCRVVDQGG